MMRMRKSSSINVSGQERVHVLAVLREFLTHPKRFLVESWNWKAATLSVLLRAPLYMIATIRHGAQAVAAAGLIEAMFSATAAGVYASFMQAIETQDPSGRSRFCCSLFCQLSC